MSKLSDRRGEDSTCYSVHWRNVHVADECKQISGSTKGAVFLPLDSSSRVRWAGWPPRRVPGAASWTVMSPNIENLKLYFQSLALCVPAL
ncbi:hypothetical protein E2C01_035172 [Portunus trituberculatus]|uniref:Uncharacterized protein n=1 Tax=Portunus trituberculatus TaxID=210409 RepID=A0A5B7F908_PORTR|nr:hypothetical protein [Portunus trituberculatus]